MPKKFGRPANLDRKIDIDETPASQKTKNAVHQALETQTAETIQTAIEAVRQDKNLPEKTREELLEAFVVDFQDLFNKIPDDYASLKQEAKFLAGLHNASFVLMAKRLRKIQDEKLYQQDGYISFQDFVAGEMKVVYQTAKNYVDVVTYFRLEIPDFSLEYSKLITTLPLMKSDEVPEFEKDNLRRRFLDDIQVKSQREIIQEVDALKKKYLKPRKTSTGKEGTVKLEKLIRNFRHSLPQAPNEQEKAILRELSQYISTLVSE
jgi:hypothetical protein